MQTLDNSLFTPTEAAVLTRLPLKAVNNAIDKKTVATVAGDRAGRSARLLSGSAIVSLVIAPTLAPELRRKLYDTLAAAGSRKVVSLESGLLKIDVSKPWYEAALRLHALQRVNRLVHSDPEIMGGDPVFHGTRVPVHLIAELLAQGASEAELLRDYPRLTAEMVRLAPLYAQAYPLRGRPRKQPWHDQPPVHQSRRNLATIDAA